MKKKIFRKDKFVKVMLNNIIKYKDYDFIDNVSAAVKSWVTECDGKEVIDGFIDDYTIVDDWCEEVEDKTKLEEQFNEWRKIECQNCVFKDIQCACSKPHKFLEQESENSILDAQEKAYLEAVIRPFKNKIVTITKIVDLYVTEKEFIDICVDREHINFPYFVANEMYKGMELGKEYTPKELGLFQDE